MKDGAIKAARGEPVGADLVFEGAPGTVAAAVYGGVPLAELEKAGALKIEGDRSIAERFLTLFPLPPKAPRPGV
jgi:hypothetical protein